MPKPLLAVLLRVHRRHQYLPLIRSQLLELSNVVDIRLVIQTDRATPAVKVELDRFACFPGYIEFEAYRDLVGGTGEQFMEALVSHYRDACYGPLEGAVTRCTEQCKWRLPDFAVLLEDDEILSDRAFGELFRLLQEWPPGLTGLRIESLFCWGDGLYNARFPRHWRHFVFRVQPGAEFNPRGLMVHAPERLVQRGSWVDLCGPALNYGYLDPDDRAKTFAAYKRAGKVDAHTICLTSPPDLKPFKDRADGNFEGQPAWVRNPGYSCDAGPDSKPTAP